MTELGTNNVTGEKIKSFGIKDKIGYGFGDLGCMVFFQFISTYLLLFYTDIMGISAAAVGTLFVIARVWDAINDPMIGMLIDKNKPTKYGKFRPYIIIFGVPMILMGIVLFTDLPIPENMRIPFIYITYICFGMLYTAVNIPYGSLASVMTRDSVERTSLSSFRTVGSMIGAMIVVIVGPMLVYDVNGNVSSGGFFTSVVIFGLIALVGFIVTFLLTKERIVQKKVETEKVNLAQTIKTLSKNKAFIGISLSSVASLSVTFMIGALRVYLFKEYFNATSLLGLAGILEIVPIFLAMPFVGMLVRKFGKKEVAIIGTAFNLVFYIILFFMDIQNPYVFIGLSTVGGFGTALVMLVTWAIIGDAIDYQEYISGERNEGLIYSSYSLFRKFAQAISGGVAAFALSFLGYQSGTTVQVDGIGQGIKNIMCGGGIIGLGLSLIVLIFVYNLSKGKVEEMIVVLNERRVSE